MKFLKTFKEELISVPLLIVVFFAINWGLNSLFPGNAFFDFYSELENIIYSVLRFIIALSVSWVGVRVIFPKVYFFLKNEFYVNFSEQETTLKYILAVSIFLMFVLASSMSAKGQEIVRLEVLQNITGQLDVKEVRNNSSPEIDKYLASVGINEPAPWCAAFVSYNLNEVGVRNPNSAWSPDFARRTDIIWYSKSKSKPDVKCCDVVTFYYSQLGRVGHVGFLIKQDKAGYFITIEGNTNAAGSRNGDGVYMKKRRVEKTYAISRYIK